MNKDQITVLITGLAKVIGTALTVHGATSAAAVVTASDTIEAVSGVVFIVASFIYSHFYNQTAPPTDPPADGGGSGKIVSLLLVVSILAFAGSGCQTTPQQATYQAAATTSVTVAAALKAYDVFAAAGKTTPQQNSEVKAAYEKYQSAFAVACDAGAAYSATGGTNGTTQAAVQVAFGNASQSLLDLENLITSFGVKLQ